MVDPLMRTFNLDGKETQARDIGGEIKPLLYKAYPLKDIVQAQTDFMNKKFFTKLDVIPHNG